MSEVAAQEQDWRRICEARDWLRRGYTTHERVEALMERIGKHRGQAAADALRFEMRRQWRTRAEWEGRARESG